MSGISFQLADVPSGILVALCGTLWAQAKDAVASAADDEIPLRFTGSVLGHRPGKFPRPVRSAASAYRSSQFWMSQTMAEAGATFWGPLRAGTLAIGFGLKKSGIEAAFPVKTCSISAMSLTRSC